MGSCLSDINNTCRKNNTAFISAFQNGLFGRVFNDFGESFTVLDKDGEELQEVMIKDISWDDKSEATVVTLLEGFKHKYEDGDHVIIKEVKGMEVLEEEKGEGALTSINGKQVSVKIINPTSFMIDDDARKYSAYQGNGIAKPIKVPKKFTFKTYDELEALDTSEGSAQA
jgi:hypothetical protein